MKRIIPFLIILIILFWGCTTQQNTNKDWQLQEAPVISKFAKKVTPENVLPEYPRPQMKRKNWMNLNGLWKFQPGEKENFVIPDTGWNRSVLVPFPVESALSGIKEHYFTIWYQRSFEVPKSWEDQKVLLHFGAVDYKTTVFVNDKKVGTHEGGYNPFTFDITSALKDSKKQRITVRVYDPTDKRGIPRGKQTLHPGGIMYTSTTGIWQTVWLEPVSKNHINHIRTIPDIDNSIVKVKTETSGSATNAQIVAQLKESDGTIVDTITGAANQFLTLSIPHAKLWSPSHPYLYDISIKLKKDGQVTDQISSYIGMRKISIQKVDGIAKLFLNNQFLFEIGPLDQGFWPAGIYTPPSERDIKYDIQMMKKYGFNMVRKHIKVEPQRWYYWTDKLGLLVWQDMPSENSYTSHKQPLQKQAFKQQLTRMIKTHWNHPSIIMWDIFNESQGQHDTPNLVELVTALDSTRLVNEASGGTHKGSGDVYDIHRYPAPGIPGEHPKDKALVIGEYGGITFAVKGHMWTKKGHGYVRVKNKKDYDQLYNRFADQLIAYKTYDGLSAAVYTQITDVESEINGLMTYDRIIKSDRKKIRKSNQRVIHDKVSLRVILPTAPKKARTWRYTFVKPESDEWMKADFDDAKWKRGKAGFGTPSTPGAIIGTKWSSSDIWIRQSFSINQLSEKQKENLVLKIHYDENSQVYINGVKAADLKGYNNSYEFVLISKEVTKSLHSGDNVIAIHTHQTEGGQYIDAGISERSFYEAK